MSRDVICPIRNAHASEKGKWQVDLVTLNFDPFFYSYILYQVYNAFLSGLMALSSFQHNAGLVSLMSDLWTQTANP